MQRGRLTCWRQPEGMSLVQHAVYAHRLRLRTLLSYFSQLGALPVQRWEYTPQLLFSSSTGRCSWEAGAGWGTRWSNERLPWRAGCWSAAAPPCIPGVCGVSCRVGVHSEHGPYRLLWAAQQTSAGCMRAAYAAAEPIAHLLNQHGVTILEDEPACARLWLCCVLQACQAWNCDACWRARAWSCQRAVACQAGRRGQTDATTAAAREPATTAATIEATTALTSEVKAYPGRFGTGGARFWSSAVFP